MTPHLPLAALWLAISMPHAFAGAPAVDAEEQSALAAGELLIRKLVPTRPAGVRVEAIADIPASRDAVWRALMDLEARLRASDTVKSLEHYRPATATARWVRWTASRFGVSVVYHTRYTAAPDKSRLIHELDPEMPNDLAYARGVYTLSPSPLPGRTRLHYDTESDFGRSLPGFIKDWLTQSGTRSFLEDIVRRSIAG